MPTLAVCIRIKRRPLCLVRVPGELRLAEGPRITVEAAAVIMSYRLDRLLSRAGSHTADTALYFLTDDHTWNSKDNAPKIHAVFNAKPRRRKIP